MIKDKPIGLAETAKILVDLFPKQHPACAKWLQSIHLPPRTVASTESAICGDAKREQATIPLPIKEDFHKKGSKKQTRPYSPPAPPKAPILAKPAFARELNCSESEWRSGIQPGVEISWNEENAVRDRIAGMVGMIEWGNGYRETMLAIKSDYEIDSRRKFTVEIAFPRLRNLQSVLVAISHIHGSEVLFEINISELSSSHIRELGMYALQRMGVR